MLHGPALAGLEAGLESMFPGNWQPLGDQELSLEKDSFAGWRIHIAPGDVQCPAVDHLIVLVDHVFPSSQVRVRAPQADSDYTWPHVEPRGVLCLRPTRLRAEPQARVEQHLAWAMELLNWDADKRRAEFRREFSSYWNHRISTKHVPIFSLLKADRPSRDIVWYADLKRARYVVAEDSPSIKRWLRNLGDNPANREIRPTRFVWLRRPWVTSEYPEYGKDVTDYLPPGLVGDLVLPGHRLPLLFGCSTPNGSAFAGVLLDCPDKAALTNGFRGVSRMPDALIRRSLEARRLIRCPVTRADGDWVHGRGHAHQYSELAAKKVAVIGCGALGGYVARLLAQAGIGEFVLVDGDLLASHNTARHVLGMKAVGKNKAGAVAKMLSEDFPDVVSSKAITRRFEGLDRADREHLSHCDVIVTAGIDIEGELALDSWRRGLQSPPPHISLWAEAYGVVGHAVALFDTDSLRNAFDENDRVVFRLTDWPEESHAVLVEAGCGNVFQPHGAVDMQATVMLSSRMVLDVLGGTPSTSRRRVWLGQRSEVLAKGGVLLGGFDADCTIRELPWT